MAASGLLIPFYRHRGDILEPKRPPRVLVRHDVKLVPRAKLYDENGAALDLTGLAVVYTLKDMATGTLVINRLAATLETQSTNPGEVYYQVTALQMANVLDGIEEWCITWSAGVTETFPVGGAAQVVRVVADIDNV